MKVLGAAQPCKIRVASYNIRHGLGYDGRIDLKRVSRVLSHSGVDLIGLQEVDRYALRSHFYSQAKYIGNTMGLRHVFGPNVALFPFGRYGNAILSRWPVKGYKNHLLPGRGEQRGLLEAQIYHRGIELCFFSTHLGLSRQDRLIQVGAILEVIEAKKSPVILAGDFNAGRNSEEYGLLSASLRDASGLSGGFYTYPAPNPSVQLDFLFLSRHWEVLTCGPAAASGASDHLAVAAEVCLVC